MKKLAAVTFVVLVLSVAAERVSAQSNASADQDQSKPRR
jgi:hypothetical protein